MCTNVFLAVTLVDLKNNTISFEKMSVCHIAEAWHLNSSTVYPHEQGSQITLYLYRIPERTHPPSILTSLSNQMVRAEMVRRLAVEQYEML